MKNTHCTTESPKRMPYRNDAERHVWQRAYFKAAKEVRHLPSAEIERIARAAAAQAVAEMANR